MPHTTGQNSSWSKRFCAGLLAGIMLIVGLNIATYYLYSSPDAAKLGLPAIRKIGFPRTFWVEDRIGLSARIANPNRRYEPYHPEFYWGAFAIDAVLGLFVCVGIGKWYADRATASGTYPKASSSDSAPAVSELPHEV